MMKPINEKGLVVSNECIGPNLYIMVIASSAISRMVQAGQFVHVKLPKREGHILRRPFSVYSADPESGLVELLYQVVGSGTEYMTKIVGEETLEMIGPIGNGWSVPAETKRALLVGGGVGAAPLFMLAQSIERSGAEIDIVLGASTKDALVCHGRYQDLIDKSSLDGSSLRCSTDDGSFGHGGFCTALVEEALGNNEYQYMAVCGPEPMMKIASTLAKGAGVFCEISLERRMACGIGACLSCVVECASGYKRACIDGPVFNAEEVVFA